MLRLLSFLAICCYCCCFATKCKPSTLVSSISLSLSLFEWLCQLSVVATMLQKSVTCLPGACSIIRSMLLASIKFLPLEQAMQITFLQKQRATPTDVIIIPLEHNSIPKQQQKIHSIKLRPMGCLGGDHLPSPPPKAASKRRYKVCGSLKVLRKQPQIKRKIQECFKKTRSR